MVARGGAPARSLLRRGREALRRAARHKAWTARRFPPAGRYLLLLYGVTLPFVVNARMTMNFQLFVLVIALLSAAVLSTRRFRGDVRTSRRLPRLAVAGEPMPYAVTVTNAGSRLERDLLLFEDFQWDADAAPARAEPLAIPALGPGETATLDHTIIPARRGVLSFTGTTLAAPDPLGLFRSLRHQPLQDRVLVLPRRHPVPPLSLPGRRARQPGGLTLAGKVADAQEFVGLRDYRPGDPPRRIHWKSTARRGRPVVKEFQEEWFSRHALVLDTFASKVDADGRLMPLDPAAFEDAVSLAASLATAPEKSPSGSPSRAVAGGRDGVLDLLFVGERPVRVTTGRGLGDQEEMLAALAAVSCCSTSAFEALSRAVLAHAGLVSGVALVLLAWDAPRRELTARLQALGVATRVFVVEAAGAGQAGAPAENAPGQTGAAPSAHFRRVRPGHLAEDLQP